MPETTKKGRTSTYILFGVGLVILATAGIALYPGFVENNLIRTMASKRTGEVERAAAARRLADLGSVRAIPGLIRAAAGFLDEEAGQRNSFTSFQAQITSLLKSRERLVQAQQAALQAEAAQGVRPGGGNVGINRTRRQSVFMLAQIKTIDSRLERFLDNVDSMFVGDAFSNRCGPSSPPWDGRPCRISCRSWTARKNGSASSSPFGFSERPVPRRCAPSRS